MRKIIAYMAISAFVAAFPSAQAGEKFDKSKTKLMYCEARLVQPFEKHPNHRIWKCETKKEIQAGFEISFKQGTMPYKYRNGELFGPADAKFKSDQGAPFGGWDEKGTRHFFWIEGPEEFNKRDFGNHYLMTDRPHKFPDASKMVNNEENNITCHGNTGAVTFDAYQFFAPDDIADQGDLRAMKGAEVFKQSGNAILSSWEVKIANTNYHLGWDRGKPGYFNCGVVQREAAKSESVLEQEDPIFYAIKVNIMPGQAPPQGGFELPKLF